MITVHHVRENVSNGIYIAGPAGNPFEIKKHGDREMVIKLFEQQRLSQIKQQPFFWDWVERHYNGEHLKFVCHCSPFHCHADSIASAIREITGTKIIRLIIAGARNFTDYHLLCNVCDDFITSHRGEQIEIISGRAKGTDSLGERFAKDRKLNCRWFPAPWKELGLKAGPIRNDWMKCFALKERAYLQAFWTGIKHKSGTWNMISRAQAAGIDVQYKIVGQSAQQNLF